MDRRCAAAAGIETKLGNHSFRAPEITAYLKNGGTLEKAAAMAILEGSSSFGQVHHGDFTRENYGMLGDRPVKIDYDT